MFAYLVHRILHRETPHKLQAEHIYLFLIYMGPLYVKFGQILATRSDMVPAEWISRLQTLQDQAPCMSKAATSRTLKKQLGLRYQQKFAHIDMIPIASASIAQVHKATLKTGEIVAIKLVKEGVPKQLSSSVKAIQNIAAIVNALVPSLRKLDIPSRVAHIGQLLLQQKDMELEAFNQRRIYANFANHPYVRVPKLIDSLCGDGILVMEFIDAIPGKNAALVPLPKQQLARRLQDTIYTMLYMHGTCHGDPHPGNIMFSTTGELILLDFGITVDLTEDEKWGLSSFYYACTRKEWRIAAERFCSHFATHTLVIRKRFDEFVQKITPVLRYHFDEHSNQWSTIGYFKDVSRVLEEFDSQYTHAFTKVELVFLSCEGFAKEIDSEIDIWANARKFTDKYSPYMSHEVRSRFDFFFTKHMPSSIAARDLASKTLVAPTHIHRYFFPSAYPVFVKRASKGYFFDLDDNEYVDLSGGYGPHILGYSHPAINNALISEINAGFVNAVGNLPEIELSKLIVAAFPFAQKAILCNSGTEANLLAIRLARAKTGRTKVAKFEGHYHGWSDQAMVSSWFRFTGSKDRPQPISGTKGSDPDVVTNTIVLQYGLSSALEILRNKCEEIACVICEPMPSSLACSDVNFLKSLRQLCTEMDIPLIFDEVVTGFRVAYGGAQTLLGVEPDLTCLGKIIGGGLPCGCVVGHSSFINFAKSSEDPFFDYDHKVFAGGTMSGNSLTCRAGTAALQYLRDNPDIYCKLRKNTESLAESLRKIAVRAGVSIMVAANHSIFSLTFSHRSSSFYREKQAGSNFKANIALAYYMRQHGIYLPELHCFMLSAAHEPDDLQKISRAFEQSLQAMINDNMFTF